MKQKRKPISEAHKAAISRAQRGRPGYWTGKTIPPAVIEKMAAAKRGRPLSAEHRRRIAESWEHRPPVSEATRELFRQKRASDETRARISDAQRGPKSTLWKGGVSTPYELERAHLAWWRRKVKERDGHRCVRCGATQSRGKCPSLHAHHILSFRDYPELRFDVDNGETLCRTCHDEEERQRRRQARQSVNAT